MSGLPGPASAAEGDADLPLGRLTRRGIERFRRHLAALRSDGTLPTPVDLLVDAEASEPVDGAVAVPAHPGFTTRLEAARWLHRNVPDVPGRERDVGLWAWLSLRWFDLVCPVRGGQRRPGRDYRHIPEPGYRHGHRHLLGGAWLAYRLHGEAAALMLCSRPDVENAFHHELMSRQAIVANPGLIRVAADLYFDPPRIRPRPGAQDPTGTVPGSLRRFIDVVAQLEVNFDLLDMNPAAIAALLPAEFDRWRQPRRRLRRSSP